MTTLKLWCPISRYAIAAGILLFATNIQLVSSQALRSNQDMYFMDGQFYYRTLFDSTEDTRFIKAAFAIGGILLGVVVGFAGQRLLRPTMAACGFALGGLITCGIISAVFREYPWVEMASLVGFVVGGALAAGLVMAIYNAGLFILGATFGVMLALNISNSAGQFIYPTNTTTFFIVLALILGLAGGAAAFKAEKLVFIGATSFIGACLIMWGIGYFGGEYPNTLDPKSYRYMSLDGYWRYYFPLAWWGYLTGTIFLTAICAAVQYRFSSKE